MELRCWQLEAPASPLVLGRRTVPDPGPDEVLVEVSGCGLCRTDLGYIYEGVPLRHPLPLTLGHEVAGRVVRAGGRHSALEGAMVVVPSVTPCGACGLCRRGRGTACLNQRFPGYDSHGGFASHVVVAGRGLCVVDPARCPRDRLPRLAIVADAVATPLEAIDRSGLAAGDLAVFVGAGALGIFGIQLASAFGATVVAVDIDEARLEGLSRLGADHTICDRGLGPVEVRERLRAFARGRGIPECGWKIFETSGTPAGQETAWRLLHRGSHLAVMGYPPRE